MITPSPRSETIGDLTRRDLGLMAASGMMIAAASESLAAGPTSVNAPRAWPVRRADKTLECVVDASVDLGSVDRRIFGTNLEWFNEAGGFSAPDARVRKRLVDLARDQKLSVLRFPGGILADYYDWRDGIGRPHNRPSRRHPTDQDRSRNDFGTPEFLALLRDTGAEGLITVNAGTAKAADAAEWIRYTNAPGHPQRTADGWPTPAGIKLWEVGNELYLPGNPGEVKITQTPAVYAANFHKFADAMRAADPSITVIAIGVAISHRGPNSEFPEWTEVLLKAAAPKIDMIAVHNAYFPLLYGVRQPPVDIVYPALWASPEAVDRSLTELSALIAAHEKGRRIGIAITEWGALFTLPTADPYWFDHVKTLGSGVYVARLLQVFMSHPRVQLANYFKFSDRTFMGWVTFDGKPKVPYWIFRLYAEATGDRRVSAILDSPTYDAPAVGVMRQERGVAEVTAIATTATKTGALFVNFVNRSQTNEYAIQLRVLNGPPVARGELRSVSANEPTAHNGVDVPATWPMKPEYEPYTTAAPDSIGIVSRPWSPNSTIALPPFSVATVLLQPPGGS